MICFTSSSFGRNFTRLNLKIRLRPSLSSPPPRPRPSFSSPPRLKERADDLPDDEGGWTDGREEGLVLLGPAPLSSLVMLGPACSSLAALGPPVSSLATGPLGPGLLGPLGPLGPGSRRGLLGPASGPPGSRGGGELMAFLKEK